jgi:hypothetical protein
MLLWKDMYPARPDAEGEEWDTWGRPPNGFIDLGCVSPSFSSSKIADNRETDF